MRRSTESADSLDRLTRAITAFLHSRGGCEDCLELHHAELAQLVIDELTQNQRLVIASVTQVGSLSDGGVFYHYRGADPPADARAVYDVEVMFDR